MPTLLSILLLLVGPASEPPADDLLGELVVEASEGDDPRAVHRIRVALDTSDTAFRDVLDVLARDLELTGALVVVPAEATPRPERVVRLRTEGSHWVAEVVSERGSGASVRIEENDTLRPGRDHRFADALVEALTGTPSDFAGRIAVVRRSEGTRRLFITSTDGDERALTDPGVVVAGVGFDPRGRLLWTASKEHGPFALWQEGAAQPLALDPAGSVYGFAFHDDRFAAAIADGSRIELWEGVWGKPLRLRSRGPASVAPAYATPKAIATIEDLRGPPRVMLRGRAISQAGRVATALTVCRDPGTERARLLWVEQGKRSSYVFQMPIGGHGGHSTVAWSGRGNVRSLACSPDGRTVVFGYDGGDLDGAGTYLMSAREGLWPSPVRIGENVATGVAWGPA